MKRLLGIMLMAVMFLGSQLVIPISVTWAQGSEDKKDKHIKVKKTHVEKDTKNVPKKVTKKLIKGKDRKGED